ncbi:DUF3221 domain-containing protein [Paenibacillus dakarensis]|uniref:DUF3221 domain-containing protein n=1 Tax=Paenibacillus dakarensis TaxID=1527293 RepID=UPI0006D56A74|nr:DUF3221 domain-containing protein [Paenibacillus dakarensis]
MNVLHKLFLLFIGLSVALTAGGCTGNGSQNADREVPGVKSPASTAPAEPKLLENPNENKEPYFEGMVAAKRSGGMGGTVLVIQGLSEDTAVNSSWDELAKHAQNNDSGAYYFVSNEQYRQLKVGQLVGIHSNKEDSSNPPYRNTSALKIIQEPQLVQVTGYRDDVVTGYVSWIDPKKNTISLNISGWANRNNHGPVEDIMHGISVPLNEDTKLVDGLGQSIEFSSLKVGDKLEVIPDKTWSYDRMNKEPFQAEQVTRVTMPRSEKLRHMLAGSGKIHTVVIYRENTIPPHDEMDFDRYVPGAFTGGISWVPYRKGEVVDFKEELMLGKLPTIIVFDDEDAIYQTDSIRELQKWFNDRAAAVRESAGGK